MKYPLLGVCVLLLAGCSDQGPRVEGRWYTQNQVNHGKVLFQAHCASCHGEAAQGLVADWKKTLADGTYPPPPLNGTAHAWHHPLSLLRRTIRNGGIPLGGVMPPFKEQLSDQEVDAIIAFFQSKWDKPIYEAWMERGGLR